MAQSLTQIYVHIVFHIKSKGVRIPKSLDQNLYDYIGGICRKINCVPIKIGGMEDHIHVLCVLSKQITLVELINKLKSNSSKWIKLKSENIDSPILKKFQWQSGYGAFSVS